MNNHLKSVDHDYLRYANCWEDADVLLSGLEIGAGDKVLSIGSAGDNCFSILTRDPELVVAVDLNGVQLKLIELKKASFEMLDHSAFLQFLGFVECDNRTELYHKIRPSLQSETAVFWDSYLEDINKGIIHQGKMENYFQSFRKYFIPLIHRKKTIAKLLSKKSEEEQSRFYNTKWNSLRWKALFKVFFGKFIMGRLGRDPQFLDEVNVSVSSFSLSKAKEQLTNVNCQSNYFIEYILKGNFKSNLPHYARKENFEKIKSRLSRLKLFKGYAEDAYREYGKFNSFNLSNIFEYMDLKTFSKTVSSLVSIGIDGAKYAYWNLMVPRNMSQEAPLLASLPVMQYGLQDKGFFYSKFHINQK